MVWPWCGQLWCGHGAGERAPALAEGCAGLRAAMVAVHGGANVAAIAYMIAAIARMMALMVAAME